MIYERLKKNEDDKVFIPTNMEKVSESRTVKFWNSAKTGILVGMGSFIIIFTMAIVNWGPLAKVIGYIALAIIYFIIIRVFIIEEPYYRKVYKQLDELKNSTSDKYWGILTFYDNEVGTAVEFMDGGIGCFVKLYRGSVVGQPENYLEKGEDTFSNFLKDCADSGYQVKLIQVTNPASKDTRLNNLTDIIKNEPNSSIRTCLELNVSKMKRVMENHYFTSQYILIYTYDYNRLEDIVEDTVELTSSLLFGEYIDRKIMDEGEIVDLHLQSTFVNYFDIINAQTKAYNNLKANKRQFDIYSINLSNGNTFILNDQQRTLLNRIYNRYIHNRAEKINILKELTNLGNTNNQNKPITKNQPAKQTNQPQPIKKDNKPKSIKANQKINEPNSTNTARQVEIEEEIEI